MSECTASTIAELHAALRTYADDKNWVYRGQRDAGWSIRPKAGREPYNRAVDSEVFSAWKRQAIEYVTVRPQNDWEWLAIAQHHGLATRLLDWAMNPLVAAYFAVRDTSSTDAIIYAAKFDTTVDNVPPSDPMQFTDLALFRPHRVVPRITRQGGVFSIHPDPKIDLTTRPKGLAALDRIRIPAEARAKLRSDLSYYGFNEATMFPDLDGISSFINWTIETGEYGYGDPNQPPALN